MDEVGIHFSHEILVCGFVCCVSHERRKGTMVGEESILLEEGRINEHMCHESREA